MQAAVRVIGREGLCGASLAAVASDAGTSKPALLYHFGSRERLLREVAVVAVGVFGKLLDSVGGENMTPRERTEASVLALFSADNRTLLVCAHELMGLGMRDPEVGALMARALDAAAVGPAKALARHQGDRALALSRSLIMAVQGHIQFWLCSGDSDPAPFAKAAARAAFAIAATPDSL